MVPRYKLVEVTNSLSLLSSGLLKICIFLNYMLPLMFAALYTGYQCSISTRILDLSDSLRRPYSVVEKIPKAWSCVKYWHYLQSTTPRTSTNFFNNPQIQKLCARYNYYQIYTFFLISLRYYIKPLLLNNVVSKPSFNIERMIISFIRQFLVSRGNYTQLQRSFATTCVSALCLSQQMLDTANNMSGLVSRYQYLLLKICIDLQLGARVHTQLSRGVHYILQQNLRNRIRKRVSLVQKSRFKGRYKVRYRIKLKKKYKNIYKLRYKLYFKRSYRAAQRIQRRLAYKLNVRLRYKIKRRLSKQLQQSIQVSLQKYLQETPREVFKLQVFRSSIFTQKIRGLRQLKSRLGSQQFEKRGLSLGTQLFCLLYSFISNYIGCNKLFKYFGQRSLEVLQRWKSVQQHLQTTYAVQHFKRYSQRPLKVFYRSISANYRLCGAQYVTLKPRVVLLRSNQIDGFCPSYYLKNARYRASGLISALQPTQNTRFINFLYLAKFFSSKSQVFSCTIPATHSIWFKHYLSFFFSDYLNSPSLCLFYSHPFVQQAEQTPGFTKLQSSKAYKILLRLSNYQLLYYVHMLLFSKNIRVFVKWFSRFIESMHFKRHRRYFNLIGLFLQNIWKLGNERLLLKGFFLFFKGKLGRGGSVRKKVMYFRAGQHSFSTLSLRYNYRRFIIRTQSGVVGGQFALFF